MSLGSVDQEVLFQSLNWAKELCQSLGEWILAILMKTKDLYINTLPRGQRLDD